MTPDGASAADHLGRLRRVLISAYACSPGQGSEPGAGWAFVVAAASHSEVWVITRRRFAAAVDAALAADPGLAERVHVTYLDLPDRVLRLKRRHRDVYWYYPLWQRAVARAARELHAGVRFDVAHHATFATDWQPSGLTALPDVPLVWGPVGGSTYLPVSLARWLGWRGVLGELARTVTTRLARRVWGDAVARRAAVVVALNADTAARFARAAHVVIEPNVVVGDDLPLRVPVARRAHRSQRQAVYVGRLVPWKGARLAVRALARPEAADWVLDIIGSGPDARFLADLAARLGVSERVRMLGQVPRAVALEALAAADAMLFPSMHDSAGWAVGEASSIGCPVICLDHGGPPLVAAENARVVPVGGDVVGGLARALAECDVVDTQATALWSADRLPMLTAQWYDLAGAGQGRPRHVAAG